MPLERYEAGPCFQGDDGSVNFAMRDASVDMIVPCWISGEVLKHLCGDSNFRDSVECYEACKTAIHTAVSRVFDHKGQPSGLRVTIEDLRNAS